MCFISKIRKDQPKMTETDNIGAVKQPSTASNESKSVDLNVVKISESEINPVEIEIPPAESSPQHILNALNNDCVQEIMRRIKNIRDLLNAAETCTCFQENIKVCFPSYCKTIRIDDSQQFDAQPNCLPLKNVQSFLSKFGHLIHTIEWSFTWNRDHDEATLNIIADFCGKTLTELIIFGHDLNFNTQSPFEALEKLALYDSTIRNFALLTQLKSLKLTFVKVTHSDWLAQEFPKLKEAKFYSFHKLKDNMLMKFLNLNPQLQSLELNCCRRISPSVFHDIGKRTPNLINLNFDPCKGLQSTFDANMIHLSRLRKLKSLRIECHRFSGRTLIDSLVEHQVPIENLTVVGAVRDLVDSIPKLKHIKKLSLSFVFEEMLVNIAKELENLEDLSISNSYDVTLCGIKDVLEHGKKLKSFSILVEKIAMNLEDFYNILTLAKNCDRVEITYEYGTVDVGKDVLDANFKWLKIEKL